MIPAVAYAIPNLQGNAKLTLNTVDDNGDVGTAACVQTSVTNGKTTNTPAASYAAVGIAGASLAITAASAVAGISSAAGLAFGHAPGAGAISPTFFEVFGWFQTMALNGMFSVNYPAVYRSYTQNFGFSSGIIAWAPMQITIDNFRARTGGNLTDNNYQYLHNSTLVWKSDLSALTKRDLMSTFASRLVPRSIITNVNGTSTSILGGDNSTVATNGTGQTINLVSGFQGYVEQLSVPRGNTFMTVLLFFAVVLGAIIAGILLLKVLLEFWALIGSFPKKLTGFRQRYWWLMAKTITNLILLFYGVWVLYCIYQFKEGDSWACQVLAGVTLGIFTLILLGFTFKIYQKAHQKGSEYDSALYDDKETWQRYSFFYENYKKSYWWLFVPVIVYMFARGCIIAALDGHGLAQASAQLGVDAVLLVLLLWTRPYTRRSGNWINIVIQVVRVVSIGCILIFVEELGFSQTTKTVVGLVLLIVQAVLTALLAILIAANAIISCCKKNPHRQIRKENEKRLSDGDELTALDAHNSMLYPLDKESVMPKFDIVDLHTRGRSPVYSPIIANRDVTPSPPERHSSQERLTTSAARMGHGPVRMYSHETLPRDLGYRQPQSFDNGYRGNMI